MRLVFEAPSPSQCSIVCKSTMERFKRNSLLVKRLPTYLVCFGFGCDLTRPCSVTLAAVVAVTLHMNKNLWAQVFKCFFCLISLPSSHPSH